MSPLTQNPPGAALMGVAEIVSEPVGELRLKLDRRIHNQRARLRQMETFHWGMSHLRTIKRFCWHLQRENRERARIVAWLREQAARTGFDPDCRFQAGQFADAIERGARLEGQR